MDPFLPGPAQAEVRDPVVAGTRKRCPDRQPGYRIAPSETSADRAASLGVRVRLVELGQA